MKLHGERYLGDPLVLIFLLILFCIGLIIIYSATYLVLESSYSGYFIKQTLGLFIGILLGIFFSRISYQSLINWGYILHGFILLLLIFTIFKGSSAMGGKRWISLWFFKFQPSEIAKITLPLCIVHYVIDKDLKNNSNPLSWLFLIGIILLTFLLIIKQPDLGSGLIVTISSFLLLYFAGIPKYFIKIGFIITIFGAPLLWNVLHTYQKKRILVFLGQGTSNKERYQLEQSKIAIGSGKIYGKGFLKGTQKNFKFLPESRTDFIFSVLAEEFGFIGVFIVILLYIFLILRLFNQIEYINSLSAYFLATGLLLPFVISIICNMGMVVGLLPVVGIPLPCMSYGLTNLWITLISLGITNNILASRE